MLVKRGDRGATLVEVMIAIVVIGIIAVPLGNALLTYLRHTDDVQRRLGASHDVQIAAAYFAQDVQSVGRRDWSAHPFPLVQSIATGASVGNATFGCGPAGTPAAVVTFLWDDPTNATGNPSAVRVAYVIVTSGGERQLRRLTCVGNPMARSTLVLVHNLDRDLTGNPAVKVTCSSPSDCAAATPPQYVTMTVRIQDAANAGSLTVTLTGQRRQT
jgi:prepilin-type N-terminal cleavage/methylation domain-containing protein